MSVVESQQPSAGMAFDHPETRDAWERTRRRITRRLWLWSGLFVVALVAGFVLTGLTESAPRPASSAGPALISVGLLVYLGALYAGRGALLRLRKARRVLEAYPWQLIAAARRVDGEKEPTGVIVQFRLTDDRAVPPRSDQGRAREWSHSMSARDPLRWNRWDVRKEQGAWFAGDLELGGVLALPGGTGLMTLQRPTSILAAERRKSTQDYEDIPASPTMARRCSSRHRIDERSRRR